MNTLILSCNTGEGHNACARAIKEYYDLSGSPCVIKDSLAFVSEEVSELVSKGHVLIYRKFSAVFGWGYAYAEHHPERFDEDSRLYHFFARGAEDLSKDILENHYDTVICTHPFSSMMLTEVIKHFGVTVNTAFVATDYTCCPGVNCSEMDLYFIPAEELLAEFSEQGIPASKLIPSGIPVRQAFYKKTPKEQAKRFYGIHPSDSHIVLACGSMGCGPMEKLAENIQEHMDEHTEITIVCGTNEILKHSLEELHRENSRVHVLGFVKNMPLLLDSTDVYITKPGGLSTTEAASKHCPMVLVNAVGGCENYNLNHFLSTNQAVSGESIDDLISASLQMLRNVRTGKFDQTNMVINSAKIIYEKMLERLENV